MEGLLTNVSSRVKVLRRLHAGASTSLLLKLVAAAYLLPMVVADSLPISTFAMAYQPGATRMGLNRRFLQAEPTLPPYDPINECTGIGPVCEGGIYVECAVGGVVGCMCSFIRACEPDISGCFLKDGKSSTYCGF